MFNPKYTLTNHILSNLTASERTYGRLEGLNIPQKLELNLERDHLVTSSYISNSIEGNPLSLPEVTNLLLGGRVPATKDEKEIKNYFETLKSLKKIAAGTIDLQLVLEIHKNILAGVRQDIAGTIRNYPVVVGQRRMVGGKEVVQIKHNPPFHKAVDINRALEELFSWISKEISLPTILKAGVLHHEFVYIHPFEDGNGRTCRIITALQFLIGKIDINKYFILDDYYDLDREMYSDMLHSADSGDKTRWLEYFTDGVKYSLDSALAKLESSVDSLPASERLSDKERFVLKLLMEKKELTTEDLVIKLKVSRQQAQSLLGSLTKKGFASKIGGTKGSYYILKKN